MTSASAGHGNKMDSHERDALNAIRAWRTRKPTWIQKVSDVITLPVTKAGEAILDVPGVGERFAQRSAASST